MIGSFSRYYHTLKFLKPVQIAARAVQAVYRPKACLRPAPALRRTGGAWAAPVAKPPSMLGPSRFRFLNTEGEIAGPSDWNSPHFNKLWLYNLHYFDYLNAEDGDGDVRRAVAGGLIDRWIAENPPASGNGWEPYPLSLRLVNWIKWALAGNGLEGRQRESLAAQARFLSKRIEFHLLANHLFANAKALAFAGLFFEGREAARWLCAGLRILRREVEKQVLDDGGHFERSPMYHAIVAEDVLDLVNVAGAFPGAIEVETVASWRSVAARMLGWLSAMTHPDGRIALFNDAAFGIAPAEAELVAYARRLGMETGGGSSGRFVRLVSSGYVRAQRGAWTLFVDAAPVGPDYQPGHAHADTLSFELSYGTSRMIVDSGTSTYAVGLERLRQRSGGAHNAVTVDGCDSSEVWSSFRVARRARIVECEATSDGSADIVIGAHDGFRRIGYGVHRRKFVLTEGGVEIADTVEGKGKAALAAFFHFHPGIVPGKPEGNSVVLSDSDRNPVARCVIDKRFSVAIERSTYHPEFGMSVPSYRIACRAEVLLPCSFTTSFSVGS